MYPFLVENMADGEAYIQNLNIEVRSKDANSARTVRLF